MYAMLVVGGKVMAKRGYQFQGSISIESSEPIVVQMSRLDTTQSNMAFLSTMGHGVDE